MIVTLANQRLIPFQVVLEPVGEEMSVWSVMPSTITTDPPPAVNVTDPANVVTCDPDPRLKALGYRLILPKDIKGQCCRSYFI